ncbi:MAG: hypothetical protein AB7H97_12600 [Pseudobdellovibrionaceae bacterium]
MKFLLILITLAAVGCASTEEKKTSRDPAGILRAIRHSIFGAPEVPSSYRGRALTGKLLVDRQRWFNNSEFGTWSYCSIDLDEKIVSYNPSNKPGDGLIEKKDINPEQFEKLKKLTRLAQSLVVPLREDHVPETVDAPNTPYISYSVLDGISDGGYYLRNVWLKHNTWEAKYKTCESQQFIELVDEICNSVHPAPVWEKMEEQKPTGLCNK